MTEHITLRAAAERYLNDPTLSRSSKSQIVYRTTFATIVELLDGDVPLRSIGRSECRTLLNSLRNLPPNFRKRWPDRSALQAIELAEAQSVGGMSTANVNEYMSKLSSLFNWAIKEELADRNPARGLRFADRLAANEKRFPFSIWQLCRIFNAPLYTGCRDDKNGYAIIGGNQPRRSRFWIPLVALYSGLRQGEICQLLTRDVRVIDGILCFIVSASSADGKSLKTAASTRIVPVHPELERVGFCTYLRERQSGGDHRLFPELSSDSLGMPSGKFSKWFTRFLVSCGANADRTCFHSFRHCFRDALREAEVPREVALTLGGWATSGPSGLGAVADAYGSGYSAKLLSTGLSSISFSGLDLSHLYEAI